VANNESSEVCGIIKPGRSVKLNRSQAVNVHKLLTVRYLLARVRVHNCARSKQTRMFIK